MKLLKTGLYFACFFAVVLLIQGCKGSGSGGSESAGPNLSSYILEIEDIKGGSPSTQITPPLTNRLMTSPGLTVKRRTSDAKITVSAPPSITGDTLELSVNVMLLGSSSTVYRARVVVSGLTPDKASMSGPPGFDYMDGLPYVVLGNLTPGETVTVTLSFDLVVPHPESLTLMLDVVEIFDRVVYTGNTTSDTELEIYTMNLDGSDVYRVTESEVGFAEFNTEWHPAGSWILFHAGDFDSEQLYVVRPDGTGRTAITCNGTSNVFASFSPDGKYIYYQWRDTVTGHYEISVINFAQNLADCSIPGTVLTDGDGLTEHIPRATLTPDGRLLLAFMRRETGQLLPPPTNAQCPTPASTYEWTAFNIYLMPLDPNTGLPTDPVPKLWIFSSSLSEGRYAWGPEGSRLMFPGGGCQEAEFWCDASAAKWKLRCVAGENRPKGFYWIEPPPTLAEPDLPYSLTAPYTAYFGHVANTLKDPSWGAGLEYSFGDWGGHEGINIISIANGEGPTFEMYMLTLNKPELESPSSAFTLGDPLPEKTLNVTNTPSRTEFGPRIMPPLREP